MIGDAGVPRFRFAFSPSARPHVANLRTALFNWALARHLRGDFVVRIDDANKAHEPLDAADEMMEALRWLSVDWDEGPDLGGDYGPYRQSQRRARHQEIAQTLVDAGHAYYGQGPNAGAEIRLRAAHAADIVVEDALRGSLRFTAEQLKDPVLVHGDGRPHAHLATTVDDHDMEISHVVRGERWLASAPVEVYLYQVLGWQQPVWVHLPAIQRPDGEELSERQLEDEFEISHLQEVGYLPEATFNYLLLLGWSPQNTQASVSKWDVRQQFRLEQLSVDPVPFEWAKLDRLNRHYLQQKSATEVTALIRPYLEDAYGLMDVNERWLEQLAILLQEDLVRLSDAVSLSEWALSETYPFSPEAEAALDPNTARPVLVRAVAELAQVVLLDERTAATILQSLGRAFGATGGAQQPYQPLRAALTGRVEGPALHKIMALLGKERCLQRIAAMLRVA